MTKEMYEKAVAHIVKMMEGKDGEEWNGSSMPMYEGVCGWGGVMSPMNRAAFVSKYGEINTMALEESAREVLGKRAKFWADSKAKGYEAMADNAEGNDPAAYEVGGFLWGVGESCKCDHGELRRMFRHHIEDIEEGDENPPRLCRICRIEQVDDIEAALKDWRPQGHEGGTSSDDVSQEKMGQFWENWSALSDEEKRTFYSLCILVHDGKGKWILIDPQGYGYARYVYLPKKWQDIFGETVREVREDIHRERAEAAAAKAKAKAVREAAYEARCAKWEHLMTAVPDGLSTWDSEYIKAGKRNILAMAKAAFPWVRFSVSYRRGWGHGYTLSWKNGPTKDEVSAATDFGLFSLGEDTFDGMTDCSGYVGMEFNRFAVKYGGVDNGVDFCRTECESDQNGDPNGKPPKVPKPKAEGVVGDAVTVTANTEKNGVEIRFASIPAEEIRTELKANGWRWTRYNGGLWYNRASEKNLAFAKAIAKKIA